MKARAALVLAVSVLVVFAAACKGNSGTTLRNNGEYDVDQRLSGMTFTTEVDKVSGQSTTVQTLKATGKSGDAEVLSTVVFKTHARDAAQQAAMGGADPRCPKEKPDKFYPYPADIASAVWIQTYNDGSSFTGKIDEAPTPLAVCTDGAKFYLKLRGSVTGGSGPRFSNVVGGTWDAEVWVDHESKATGTVQARFQRN